MARVTITPHVIKGYNEACCTIDEDTWMKTVSAGGEAEIDVSNMKSNRLAVIANANGASSSDVTVLAGNGIQGVTDMTVMIDGNKTVAFVPESGRFKNVSGADAGKIVLKVGSNSGISLAAIVLP